MRCDGVAGSFRVVMRTFSNRVVLNCLIGNRLQNLAKIGMKSHKRHSLLSFFRFSFLTQFFPLFFPFLDFLFPISYVSAEPGAFGIKLSTSESETSLFKIKLETLLEAWLDEFLNFSQENLVFLNLNLFSPSVCKSEKKLFLKRNCGLKLAPQCRKVTSFSVEKEEIAPCSRSLHDFSFID